MSYLPPPEYRRRAWRLYAAWMDNRIPTKMYVLLWTALRDQRASWRNN